MHLCIPSNLPGGYIIAQSAARCVRACIRMIWLLKICRQQSQPITPAQHSIIHIHIRVITRHTNKRRKTYYIKHIRSRISSDIYSSKRKCKEKHEHFVVFIYKNSIDRANSGNHPPSTSPPPPRGTFPSASILIKRKIYCLKIKNKANPPVCGRKNSYFSLRKMKSTKRKEEFSWRTKKKNNN